MIAMGFEAKTTGKRIADIRGKNNMSQEKLAETLSKSVSLISLYEGGHRVPPPDVLYQLSELFAVSADYLLGLTDNPNLSGGLPPDHARLKAIEVELEKIDLARIIEIERLMRKG